MNRRMFLGASMASAAAFAQSGKRLPIKKALYISMLGKEGSYEERFQRARDAGFDEIECATVESQSEAEEIKKAAEKTKLRIHSVMNQAHWKFPLSSSDPSVVDHSMKGMETSLRNANFWGADTVLLVPAVVNPETSYRDAWTRSQAQIRKLLPLAEKMKVVIGIEEVWNKFLLSPLEMARYVDEFKSAWVKAYVDVGNMVFYGYPQDWIRTLDKRIAKLHIKDFQFKDRKAEFVALREGDIDWKAVHKALADVGYRGTATLELGSGDLSYLKEVSRRFDMILDGV
jgi:L-ribulose-5-phosphate 3-epimerase